MTDGMLIKQIEEVASAARDAGQYVTIDETLPTLLVSRGTHDEFFFQEHEAEEVIREANMTVELLGCEVLLADVILWQAQGW